MDSRYRLLTLDIPWAQRMPSRDVNAATRLTEASWRRDNELYNILTSLKLFSYMECNFKDGTLE